MLGVEAQAGIRMEDFGPGKPLFSELVRCFHDIRLF